MRTPPPVSVLVPGAAWRGVSTAVPAAACGALAAWAAAHAGLNEGGLVLAAVAAGLPATLLAWRLAAAVPARLQWDGQRWLLDGQPAQVALTIDLGLAVLLRCAVDGGAARWLGITRREAGGAWHGLRVALHAALAAADAPAADPTARRQR